MSKEEFMFRLSRLEKDVPSGLNCFHRVGDKSKRTESGESDGSFIAKTNRGNPNARSG